MNIRGLIETLQTTVGIELPRIEKKNLGDICLYNIT